MQRPTARLRHLLASKDFFYWPSLFHPLAGRVAEQIGIESAYVGGYVTGASLAVSEPLLTVDEQVRVAGLIARGGNIPIVADAGADIGCCIDAGGGFVEAVETARVGARDNGEIFVGLVALSA